MKKKLVIVSGCFVVVYFLGAVFFNNRVMPNTYINELSLSMIKYEQVENYLKDNILSREIEIVDEVIGSNKIAYSDVGLVIDSEKLIDDIKSNETLYRWPFEIAAKSVFETANYISLDEQILKNKLIELGLFDEQTRKAPHQTMLKLNDETYEYEVVEKVEGTIIDQEKMISNISEAILNFDQSFNTQQSYVVYDDITEKVISDAQKLNDQINRNVSMKIGDESIDVPRSIIAQSISVDEAGNILVDETNNTLYQYLYDQSLQFDSSEVGFGYKSDSLSDMRPAYEQIVNELQTGETSDIIGIAEYSESEEEFLPSVKTDERTYIEISIGKQIMWVFKDNEVLVQTPVRTGNVAAGLETPKGEYTVIDKETDKVLNGPSVGFDYMIPVNYWMRLTYDGIGIHDLDGFYEESAWDLRGSYTTNGSHGCINTPGSAMEIIYQEIPVGTPVYIVD